MVKKRKSTAAATAASTQPKKQQKKQEEEVKEEAAKIEEKVVAPVVEEKPTPVEEKHEDEDVEEVEVEEEVEEEEEEEEEVEEVEEEEEEEGDDNGGDDEDDDPISSLIEPFTKDQLLLIVREAAEKHADVAARVRKLADQDIVHRKIFVHGLGWDTTAETLIAAFKDYGEIEDCKAVTDKLTGKSKGYGFILFKTRAGARKALKEPQKTISGRTASCQLAALGPASNGGSTSGGGGHAAQAPVGYQSELTQRKIYISNVSAELDPTKLTAYFAKFGEIEDGPLGLDKSTGKFKGFCLFVYKTLESARKALEEPHKQYEGHTLHCQRAIDGPKPGKGGGHYSGGGAHGRGGGGGYGRGENPNLAGAIGGPPATAAGLMGQSIGAGYGPGAGGAALNPALGQALTALLASQGAGLGLNSLLGTLGAAGAGGGHLGQSGGYVGQAGIGGPGLGGYGSQGGLQSAYPSQHGQGGVPGRSQHGYNSTPYGGH